MVKFILGLVSLGGVSLAGLYMVTGFDSGASKSGGCCHGSAPVVSITECAESAEPSCCSLLSRSVAVKKSSCCEAAEKGVEVLTIAPREVDVR